MKLKSILAAFLTTTRAISSPALPFESRGWVNCHDYQANVTMLAIQAWPANKGIQTTLAELAYK